MRPKRHPAVFIGHEIYRQAAYGTLHPLAIPRVEAVVDLCHALGGFRPGEYRVSPRATDAQLARFHHPGYVAALRHASASGQVEPAVRERHAIGTMENPLFAGVFERAATSVGGSIHAALLAMEGRIAFHPAGGTHHGRPGRASGFCYFNDPAFALLTLLDAGLERVVYLDLDAHHGDAVQDAFAADPRVHTISIHEAGRWPHTGAAEDTAEGRACNLPVPKGFNDAELAMLMEEVVLPLASGAHPQAVVLTCGGDALAGDPLASMALSNGALWDAVEKAAALAPVAVVLGGGGYNPWTLTRYWSGMWARLAGHSVPEVLPPEAQAVLARLSCDLVEEEDMKPEWLRTLADPSSSAQVRDAVRTLRDEALARMGLAGAVA